MQKKLANLFRLILSDKNTRNLSFFLLLNLIFAFVELFYGLWTNSLGLISDAFHMFFDCSALLLGLAASIIAKWRPNEKFTYGFGRAEILAGLANGLFLLFIALFIMKEAIERSFEPPDVHHERLFVISVLGFIVNIIGIFVFQHGGQGHQHHHHGIGGCSHSSPSSNKRIPPLESKGSHTDHSSASDYHNYPRQTYSSKQQTAASTGVVALDMNGYPSTGNSTIYTNNLTSPDYLHQDHHHNHQHQQQHNHDHSHHHNRLQKTHNHSHNLQHHHVDHHDHHQHSCFHVTEPLIGEMAVANRRSNGRGQIMQSVFLHIVADTLGSIGVMISAVLMNQFGWMIADPLCSLFIAILISISVYPLLRDSIYVLMQRVPVDIQDKLPECLNRIQTLDGVLSIHETHFWTLCSDTYIGCLKLEVTKTADYRYILSNAKTILNQVGVDRVHVQIDQV